MTRSKPRGAMIEPLEGRVLLIFPAFGSVGYTLSGLLLHGQFSHTVAAVALTYTPSSHHNYTYGEVDIRFSRHDAVRYPFVYRLRNGHFEVHLSETDGSYINAFITKEPAGTPAAGTPVSIAGEAQLANHFGTFSARLAQTIPL